MRGGEGPLVRRPAELSVASEVRSKNSARDRGLFRCLLHCEKDRVRGAPLRVGGGHSSLVATVAAQRTVEVNGRRRWHTTEASAIAGLAATRAASAASAAIS